MKKRLLTLSLFLTAIFIGCRQEAEIEDPNIIFDTYQETSFVVGGKILDLKAQAVSTPFSTMYDRSEHKLWIHSIENEKSKFQFLKSDGFLSEPLTFSYNDVVPVLGGCPFVNKNIALIAVLADAQCISLNLSDGEYSVIDLKSAGHFEVLYGFSGDYIFGKNWSYYIERNETKYFPLELSCVSYMAEIDRIVGIDQDGNTVLLDYKTDEYETLPLKKRSIDPDRFYYPEGSLYYVNGNYVYYSEYSKWYPPCMHFTFFQRASEPHVWYRYDKNTGETVRIKSPSEFSQIIGILK